MRLYKCRECWDTGWVVVDPVLDTVRPCMCNEDQYARWAQGEFEPVVHRAKGFEEPSASPSAVYQALEDCRRKLDPSGDQ